MEESGALGRAWPGKGLVIVTGSYGSGKTEYAVNLAAKAAESGTPCVLVDLDVVNPYFRSRDVREEFRAKGIEVVAPEGGFAHADLPMLSPKVLGAIKSPEKHVILDVGGDPMGARVLGRFAAPIRARGYYLCLVVNTRRPDTRTQDEVCQMMERIEKASTLSVTGIMANTHLMAETTVEVVNEGVAVARKVAAERGLDFTGACVLEDLLPGLDIQAVAAPVFIMRKYMKKPWEGK